MRELKVEVLGVPHVLYEIKLHDGSLEQVDLVGVLIAQRLGLLHADEHAQLDAEAAKLWVATAE